jgi:hypothetical protein
VCLRNFIFAIKEIYGGVIEMKVFIQQGQKNLKFYLNKSLLPVFLGFLDKEKSHLTH